MEEVFCAMGSIKVGDWVEVVDETIKGKIMSLEGNMAVLETEDGFLQQFELSQLVKATEEITVSNYEAYQMKKQKTPEVKKKKPSPKSKKDTTPKMEVDLHIHQLTASTKGMTNFDILNLQLETAKRQLEFAIGKKIQKVVFIHGVGEGVLKEELHYLFKRYEGISYYDAEFQKYGFGATEVFIRQNP